MLGSFFEQDHPLNLFISGVYERRWPICARVSIKTWCSPKSDRRLFFLTLTVRGPFHKEDFKWKKYGGRVLISEKTKVLYTELKARAEAATGSYSERDDSLQYIYSVSVTKNHWNMRSRCLIHEFSFTDIF